MMKYICLIISSFIPQTSFSQYKFTTINSCLDTIVKDENYWLEYINRTKLSANDSILIENVKDKFIVLKNNNLELIQFRKLLETIILNNEIPYVLAKELFNLYLKNYFADELNIGFIINASYTSKRFIQNKYGGSLIYLNIELSSNCDSNFILRNKIINSDFLYEDYKLVDSKSYLLFFKNCNDGLSIDDMIRKTGSKKKKRALKEIKYMIQKDNFNSLNLNTKPVK